VQGKHQPQKVARGKAKSLLPLARLLFLFVVGWFSICVNPRLSVACHHGPNLLRYSCEVTKPVTIPRGSLVESSTWIQAR